MKPTATPAFNNLLDLSGETVLVTGASSAIGGAIATRLAEAGAQIVAHYHRNEAAANVLLEQIGAGQAVAADLSDERAIEQMLETAGATMLVNNAARQDVASLRDMSIDDWRAMMAVNLDAAFLLTQCVAASWTARGVGGAIVNIASIEGVDPAVGHAHYATSKAGLIMMTRAAALEFGPQNIRINSVAPGLIDSGSLADEWPDGMRRWLDRVPLGRAGAPNDVADAVLFLLSSAARWISGHNLVVDGGISAQSKW